jgi:hypothetical protein
MKRDITMMALVESLEP